MKTYDQPHLRTGPSPAAPASRCLPRPRPKHPLDELERTPPRDRLPPFRKSPNSTSCATTRDLSQKNFGVETGLLPARLLHDEVQPEDQRGNRRPAGRSAGSIRSSRTRADPGRPRALLRAAGHASPRSPGMDGVHAPARSAGAHGELAGVMIMQGATTRTRATSSARRSSSPTRPTAPIPPPPRSAASTCVEIPVGPRRASSTSTRSRRCLADEIAADDAHQSEHARACSTATSCEISDAGPRRRRPGLLRRREPERDARPVPAGRPRLRHHAHQPPQDVLHAARRRRSGIRTRRRRQGDSSRSCPTRRSKQDDDGYYVEEERPTRSAPSPGSSATSRCGSGPMPTCRTLGAGSIMKDAETLRDDQRELRARRR
ncbi:MAG: hypothetical protein MZU97_12755 [Bacillus subtilis]|nr:hypothetical protein [Bacillus subtilis]